ncbi:MAG TPA: ABC transporter permease [Bacillota bacterium]|nr:ABC transporter permease [Bacillota bacterium]HPT86885.1 ABC transporter permease [Bacillota bacterium]
MRWTENALMALKNLRSNRVRSFLTMLGIIIGVGAVIAMVSLGDGAKRQITDKISEIGSNLITVSPGRNAGRQFNNHLVELLEDELDYVSGIAPAVRGNKTAEAKGNSTDTTVLGITPDYGTIRNYKVAYGSFVRDSDVNSRRKVAVIGSYLAEELFPGTNPVGEEIRVGGVRLEVIGVLESKGQSGFGNGDNLVFVPLTTAQERIFGNNRLTEISIQASDASYVNAVAAQVEEKMMAEFEDEDKFNVNNMAEMLSTAEDMTGIMTLLLAGIAGISLLVGGIGIMNIMLVSVTERIREIGIRKAIGAQSREILLLFLIEAITLSLLGGLVGILSGGGLAVVVGKLIGWNVQVSTGAVLIAFFFSLAVGLFFGVYPAYKASNLNPIEALRNE